MYQYGISNNFKKFGNLQILINQRLIYGFLAKTFKIPQKHHPETNRKILFIYIIDIET